MNAETYIKNVLITEARDFAPVKARLQTTRTVRLMHTSAGITSEITELYEAISKEKVDQVNIMEECGDILWYVGVATDELTSTDSHAIGLITAPSRRKLLAETDKWNLMIAVSEELESLTRLSGQLVDLVFKKNVMYGKELNVAKITDIVSDVHERVEVILALTGYTLEQARERNIAKLKARYGEKFTEAAARDRDLETERQVLEGRKEQS